MRRNSALAVLALAWLLGGCATTYQPLKVDEKTALYPTSVKVDPGGIQAFVTTTDPKSFPAVLLLTESNYRPGGFSFMVRDALAQVGMTNVYTPDELTQRAQDEKFPTGQWDSETIKRFSESVAPLLVVSATYTNEGDAHALTELTIQDGRTGQVLLKLDHPRLVWSNFDSEAIYPVLNQLRLWVKACTPGAV